MRNETTGPGKTDPAIKVRARIVLAISDRRRTAQATGLKATGLKATGLKATGPRATDPRRTGLKAIGRKAIAPPRGIAIGVSVLRVRIDVERARSAGSARSRTGPRRCRTRRS